MSQINAIETIVLNKIDLYLNIAHFNDVKIIFLLPYRKFIY